MGKITPLQKTSLTLSIWVHINVLRLAHNYHCRIIYGLNEVCELYNKLIQVM